MIKITRKIIKGSKTRPKIIDSTPTIIDAINVSTKIQINQNLKILCM